MSHSRLSYMLINSSMTLVFIFLASLLVVSCTQTMAVSANAPAAQSNFANPNRDVDEGVDQNTLKLVNSAFYQAFMLGDWRYQGAEWHDGRINAYIKIPEPLDMAYSVQQRYLRQSICPSAEQQIMWQRLHRTPLEVHLFIQDKTDSIQTNCPNPLV